ncbi:MAG: hypothetical protein ACE5HW_00995 [Candidatus Methanofastidiosia archaeon]
MKRTLKKLESELKFIILGMCFYSFILSSLLIYALIEDLLILLPFLLLFVGFVLLYRFVSNFYMRTFSGLAIEPKL